MIDFIENNIRTNDYALVGVHTNANQLTSNGYSALQKLGFPTYKNLSFEEIFVLIG